MLDLIVEKTKEYLSIPAVVGHERFFMEHLYADFKALGCEVYKYEGLLLVQGAQPFSNIVCAHIDRHGLISLGDNEYVYAAQYIREIKYGENNKSSRALVQSIAQRFEGEAVYAYHPDTGVHIAEGVIEACYPDMRNDDALFEVEGILSLEHNIPLAYARQATFEDGLLKGQIDNVISVAVCYALCQAGYQGTMLLTCEEEIGKSWIHIAEYLKNSYIDTKRLIVIDTSPYSDLEFIETGPIVFRKRDKNAVFNTEFSELLRQRAELLDLPYEFKDEMLLARGKEVSDLGCTELGRLVENTEGHWNGATVQIPTLMYHTSNETTTEKAIRDYYIFLHNILIQNPV
jgi:putative aminopeptidase FrvX